MAMTGILSNFDNVDTFEEKDEILNAYIKQIVNNTDDSNSEETALQQLIEFALNNKKRDYKENILKHLEDQWEKFEAMYLKGSYEIRKNVIAGMKKFSLMLPDLKSGAIEKNNYKIVENGKFEVEGINYQCIVVERIRLQDDRTTRYFLAPELDYLIIKVEDEDQDGDTSLELKKLY